MPVTYMDPMAYIRYTCLNHVMLHGEWPTLRFVAEDGQSHWSGDSTSLCRGVEMVELEPGVITTFKDPKLSPSYYPIGSMGLVYLPTLSIKNQPKVGVYAIHGSCGYEKWTVFSPEHIVKWACTPPKTNGWNPNMCFVETHFQVPY